MSDLAKAPAEALVEERANSFEASEEAPEQAVPQTTGPAADQASGPAAGQASGQGSGKPSGQVSVGSVELANERPTSSIHRLESAKEPRGESHRAYEWDQNRWEKLLHGCDESLVMQLKPLNIRYHFDPMTWKFRTEPEFAWSIPTGNRTPNREALKALRKEMEKNGELPPRRHHHHHHHHHRGRDDSEATKKERKSKKKKHGKQSDLVVATPMQMALQARGSHIIWSGHTPSTGGSGVEDGKKEKFDKRLKSKKSGRSHDTDHDLTLLESSLAAGPIPPAPLQIVEVTFFSVTLHWYDLTADSEDDEVEQVDSGDQETHDEGAEATDDATDGAVEAAATEKDASPSIEEEEEEKTTEKTVKTITLQAAERKASLEAHLLGDSRPIYILEGKENDITKEWKPICVGYGRHYMHDNLRPRTTYLYRARAMDRERGTFSPWNDSLEVTTKRLPHTVQDLLLKVTTNDLKGLIEILDSGEVNANTDDPIGLSPLMRAAQQDKTKFMQALLRHGALVDFQSKEQRRTALMVAAYSGNLQAVKCLRLFEASYDLYDSSHLTALHWAVDSANMDLVEYMLVDGANIECIDNQGWTPLHRTALVGSRTEGVCEVLLRYGAKIDRPDKDMKTPLMNATISNKGQIAQILIARGADVFAQNKDGRTAYDLACALERKGTMMLLEALAKSQKRDISTLHGQGLKGGAVKMEGDEIANLDRFARQLAIKMRKKPSIDTVSYANLMK